MTRPDDRSVPALGALALLVLVAVLMVGLLLAAAALYGFRHEQSLGTAFAHVQTDLLTLTAIQVAAMASALILGLKWFDPESGLREGLSLSPVRGRTLALCLAAGACLQFPLTELSNVLHAYVFGPEPLERQLALQNMLEAHTLGRGIVVVACLVAAVPTMEELLFRGLFLFGLARRYGNGFAVGASACLFGIAHLAGGSVTVVYATCAGLILGMLAVATRSTWPGIALHAAVNAMPVLLPERVLPIRGFNIPSALPQHLPAWLVWIPLLLAFALLAMARRIEYASEP